MSVELIREADSLIIERTEGRIVTKILVGFGRDAAEVVTVRRDDKDIVCFSTQVGCAMRCGFCVSGQASFVRDLTAEEMSSLVETALRFRSPGNRPLVLSAMGEGEPSLNIGPVLATLARFHVAGTATRLALSTVGPSLGRLKGLVRAVDASDLPVKVQFSLHAAKPEVRAALVRTSKVSPWEALSVLVGAVRTLELNVVLLDGVNDSREDAEALVALLRDHDPGSYLLKVNAFNGSEVVPFVASPPGRRRDFLSRVADAGIPTEVYETDGTEISAACGQLRHRVLSRLAA